MDIYIVTNSELGWDCVIGAFTNIEAAQAQATAYGGNPEDNYYPITITTQSLKDTYEED